MDCDPRVRKSSCDKSCSVNGKYEVAAAPRDGYRNAGVGWSGEARYGVTGGVDGGVVDDTSSIDGRCGGRHIPGAGIERRVGKAAPGRGPHDGGRSGCDEPRCCPERTEHEQRPLLIPCSAEEPRGRKRGGIQGLLDGAGLLVQLIVAGGQWGLW